MDEAPVQAPAAETAAEKTEFFILIFPREEMDLHHRRVLSGFSIVLVPRFTSSFFCEPECFTTLEPLLDGEVDSTVQLDVTTANDWFVKNAERLALVHFASEGILHKVAMVAALVLACTANVFEA